MTKDEIPQFVAEIAATGCDITALADQPYWFIGDADLPEADQDRVQPLLREISERYGPRDHLHHDIIDYLREIGRIPSFQKQ
ncbi:hypothetical protein ACQKP1_25780 [Allorhizobium sp. NPDC080224]|uniref:hypothetical protein n=1 Tax=Allorhizobium sp. NPDC080224 TaxID=3390547 RepID=UPI003D061207